MHIDVTIIYMAVYKKYSYEWRIGLETTLATNIQREPLKFGYNYQAQPLSVLY